MLETCSKGPVGEEEIVKLAKLLIDAGANVSKMDKVFRKFVFTPAKVNLTFRDKILYCISL